MKTKTTAHTGYFLIALSAFFFTTGIKSVFAQDTVRTRELHRIFENYYQQRLKLFPLEATAAGDTRYNSLLPNDGTEAYRNQVHDFYTKYKRLITSFRPENLGAEDRISLLIFKDILNRELAGEVFHREQMPFAQFFSLPLKFGQLGGGNGDQPFKTVEDYDSWLQRMKSFGEWTDTTISNFRKGVQSGMVLPKALVVKMIPHMQSLAQEDSAKNIFYGPLRNMPDSFPKTEKIRLSKSYQEAITTIVIPSYKKLAEFFGSEYMNAGGIL